MGSRQNQLQAMKDRHRQLDEEIRIEEGYRWPDRDRLRLLKLRKLKLKDQIEILQARLDGKVDTRPSAEVFTLSPATKHIPSSLFLGTPKLAANG